MTAATDAIQDRILSELLVISADVGELVWVARDTFESRLSLGNLSNDFEHAFGNLYELEYIEVRQLGIDSSKLRLTRVGQNFYEAGYRFFESAQTDEGGIGPIPAADRIVAIGDNSLLIDEIETLKRAVVADNDESGKLSEERDRLVAELSAGQTLLRAPSFRLKAITTVLLSALTFIATEFAGGVIGDLAVKLIGQIKPLIGL